MLHISPGVYISIVDQSEYVNAAPVSSVFVPFFSQKGPDNKLSYINGQKTLRTEFTAENLTAQGKGYREGWMDLDRWLAVSGSAYGIRLLPDTDAQAGLESATYANLTLGYVKVGERKVLALSSLDSMKGKAYIEAAMKQTIEGGSAFEPVFMLTGYGRGEYYNDVSITITPIENEDDVYSLDMYMLDDDGDPYVLDTRRVSFLEDKKDLDGESLYICDVLDMYSTMISAYVNADKVEEINQFRSSDIKPLGIVNVPPEELHDGDIYAVGDAPEGAFADLTGMVVQYDETEAVWNVKLSTVKGDVLDIGPDEDNLKAYIYDGDSWELYDGVSGLFSVSYAGDTQNKFMANGSSGNLYENGVLNPEVAKVLLVRAYTGLIDDEVLDTETLYFPFVLCPYADPDILNAAHMLCQTREDALAFGTLPDSNSPDADIANKRRGFNLNDHQAAVYGNWSKIYNADLGKDIWISPVYHIARVMPMTLNTATISDAPAGFANGMCSDIKELRYNPKIGDRDNLYKERINYPATFRNGTCLYQQLTSQMKDSSLSDINIVNVVLYIKHVVREYCTNFIYYKNNAETRQRIQSTLDEFLKDLKDSGNLADYSLTVYASDYDVKMKLCRVAIILWPVKVLEKILVTQYIR